MRQRTWPKRRPALSPADAQINEDWQNHWLTTSQNQFSAVQAFNHGFIVKAGSDLRGATLEIGAGGGDHLALERDAGNAMGDYRVLELRENLAQIISRRFPAIQVSVGSCEDPLPYAAGSLTRIIAIHVLEHLANLPAFLSEAARVLAPQGRLLAVIPCEGGLGYALGRRVTSQAIFERRYKTSYQRFIETEHLSTAREILAEVRSRFVLERVEYWPLRVPSVDLNLCIGLRLAPHPAP